MPGLEDIFQFLVTVDLLDVIKAMVLLGLIFYIVFALIVVRQVELMRRTLNGALDVPLKLLAVVHLAVALGVFLVALIIL